MRNTVAKRIKRHIYGPFPSGPEARTYIDKQPGTFWLVPINETEALQIPKLQIQADPMRQAYQHAKRRWAHEHIHRLS